MTALGKLICNAFHRRQCQIAVILLNDFLHGQVARPARHLRRGGGGFAAARPAYHESAVRAFHVLGGVEQLAVQPLGFAVGAVGRVGHGVPEGVVLGGIGEVILVAQLEGVAAFQVPEAANGVGEDHAVIGDVAEITTQGVFEDAGHAALGGGDGQGDGVSRRVIIRLRIAEIPLLADLGGRGDVPALNLFKLGGSCSLSQHDLFHVFVGFGGGMAGVEEQVFILHLHNGAGARPAVLTAAAVGFDDGIVVFRIGNKILGGG